MSSGSAFNGQINFLKNHFEVYAPDLTGFGTNPYMPYPYSLDDYVESVREYTYKKGIKNPHVIAHSFGARIVIKLASSSPTFFDKIVLTGGAGLKPKPTLKRSIKRLAFNFLKRFVDKQKLKNFYSSEYNALPPVMQQSFIKIVNEHLDHLAPLIQNKTLLIYGQRDLETPLYMAKKLNACIKNSRLVTYQQAGHFAFIDCPLKFNLEVREFLLS